MFGSFGLSRRTLKLEGTQHSIIRGYHMRNERYPTVPIGRDAKKSAGCCEFSTFRGPWGSSLHCLNLPACLAVQDRPSGCLQPTGTVIDRSHPISRGIVNTSSWAGRRPPKSCCDPGQMAYALKPKGRILLQTCVRMPVLDTENERRPGSRDKGSAIQTTRPMSRSKCKARKGRVSGKPAEWTDVHTDW